MQDMYGLAFNAGAKATTDAHSGLRAAAARVIEQYKLGNDISAEMKTLESCLHNIETTQDDYPWR